MTASGRAGVAAVSFGAAGGGLAYVARLLRAALVSPEGDPPWTTALEPARYNRVSAAERARFAGRVVGAQLAGRVDWIAFNHVGIARVQRYVPSRARRPYAVFVHDVEAWDPGIHPSRRATLREARLRLANSRYTAERVARAHPEIGAVVACPLGLMDDDGPPDAAVVPPAGLPASPPGTARLSPGLAEIGAFSVLIVGRMDDGERYKGHDELLECWPGVVDRVPGAQLVVVGLGNGAARLRDRARALGVAPAVLFCGFLPAGVLAAVRKRVALFAMPSAREGFGLVYLEAMRAGLPCIGSTADAAGDIIVDGETGFLVERSNRHALTEAIVTLLLDGARRSAMGEAGRRRYAAHFTAAHFAARLRDILHTTPMIGYRA